MKTVPWNVYAPTRRKEHWKLPDGLDWKTVEESVKRLQMRIAQAAREEKYRKMHSLQWLLAHSHFAKLLAIRRVTSNKGRTTPGVDGVVWKTSRQKMAAVTQLRRRGYRAFPLRRVYIPKKSGKLRPLGIPTMRDRAMQALYAFTLAPIAETRADPNSYGFRYGRCCADALAQCHVALSRSTCSPWILEADIKSCFDEISHQWLLENIPVDAKMLAQWLAAGFLDKGRLYPSLAGTPQGGIVSPVLMNMTLDGLERTAKRSVPWYIAGTGRRTGVNVIRYADDFVITGKTKELLESKVLPAVRSFLAQRGLRLSSEKTRIVRMEQGFDFLGQNVRRYRNGKVLVRPTRKAVQRLQEAVRRIVNAHQGDETWQMIRRLNQIIRGWANYHRHACSSRIFEVFDSWLFWEIKRWLHRRHPNKGRRWIMKRYYRKRGNDRWVFHAARRNDDGNVVKMDLIRAGRTRIVRHIKIKAAANPYDPGWNDYFMERRLTRRHRNQDGRFVEEYGWPKDNGRLKSA
jgi:RNA-directed DNA polymerase